MKRDTAKKVNLVPLLRRSIENERLIKVWRKKNIDRKAIIGFPVDVSHELLIIQSMNDSIQLDSYIVIRIKDIHSLDSSPNYRSFYEKALKMRHMKCVRSVGVELTSFRTMLESADYHYPLLVLHKESGTGGSCAVGRIKTLTDRSVTLRWLTPGARWEGVSSSYKLNEITRVDFGGLYENALAMVAGIKVTVK